LNGKESEQTFLRTAKALMPFWLWKNLYSPAPSFPLDALVPPIHVFKSYALMTIIYIFVNSHNKLS